MTITSKGCKPDNFEPHNSLKLSFTNIPGLRSNFVECESFLESNSPDFSVRGLSSFNPKRFYYSFAWSCTLCERRTSFCAGLISRKLCGFLLMSLTSFTSLSVLLLFPLSPCSSLSMVFDSISSNIDEVLSINPSANFFVFEDFNVHHKDCLTYSGGTDRLGELCYNFSISNDLTQIVNFLLGFLTVTLLVLHFWIYFFFLTPVFVLQ